MKQALLILILLTIPVIAQAQTPMMADPAEQARIKPLADAEAKARETLLAKTATLPQAKAVADAKAAYDKAVVELDKAAKELPEHQEWLKANAAVVSAAYQIMADHKLSSVEYKPELDEKKRLLFPKITVKP